MKALTLFAASAVLMITAFAQDAKMSPTAPAGPTQATERALSENEVLKLQLSIANAQLLQDKYRIQEYQKEIQSISDEQEKIFFEACKSVGVPADKIKTECQVTTGMGPDGKPVMGQDGKPMQGKVWWNKPAPVPVIADPKK